MNEQIIAAELHLSPDGRVEAITFKGSRYVLIVPHEDLDSSFMNHYDDPALMDHDSQPGAPRWLRWFLR